MAFIAGSFAALLLAVALVEDTLLERHLYGHTLARDSRLENLSSTLSLKLRGRKEKAGGDKESLQVTL